MFYLLYQTLSNFNMPTAPSIADGECLNEENYFSFFFLYISVIL